MTSARSLRIGEAILGAVILGLGVFIVVETAFLRSGPGYALVGPALFPYLIAAGLLVIGLLILREAGFGHIAHDRGVQLDWSAVGLISLGLIVQIALLPYLGWILATTVLFVIVAWAFSSRRPLLDAAIGLVLVGGTFVLFNYGLGLDLPAGPLSRLGL